MKAAYFIPGCRVCFEIGLSRCIFFLSQRVGAGTIALGIAEGAYQHALAYALEREQFGRPIAEFQGLQWMLVDMDSQIEAAQALIYKAAASADHNEAGFPDIKLAAQAKIVASEMAIRVTNDALQVYGAAGVSGDLPLASMYQGARTLRIADGPDEVHKILIAKNILRRYHAGESWDFGN